MEFKEAFFKSVAEVSALYGLNLEYKQDLEGSLLPISQVNVLLSFGQSPKGKITFGFSRAATLKIAAALLGEEVNSLDLKIKNSISEFVTFITSLAIGKTAVIGSVSFSAPVIITGENMLSMISRVKAIQLAFQMDDDLMLLTYCIE